MITFSIIINILRNIFRALRVCAGRVCKRTRHFSEKREEKERVSEISLFDIFPSLFTKFLFFFLSFFPLQSKNKMEAEHAQKQHQPMHELHGFIRDVMVEKAPGGNGAQAEAATADAVAPLTPAAAAVVAAAASGSAAAAARSKKAASVAVSVAAAASATAMTCRDILSGFVAVTEREEALQATET